MEGSWLLCLLQALLLTTSSQAGNVTEEFLLESRNQVKVLRQLHHDLLSDYVPDVQALNGSTGKTIIEAHFDFLQLIKVDDIKQSVTARVRLRLEWFDPNLLWLPANYSGWRQITLPYQRIWHPKLQIINRITDMGNPDDYTSTARVTFDGMVMIRVYTKSETFCNLNMTLFPYDSHTCQLLFGSWDSLTDAFEFSDVTASVAFGTGFLENSEFEIDAISVEVVPRFAQNRLRITINRRPALIQKTLLAPFAIMSVLPCFAFILPPDSEAKLDMMLSTMLSYAVYMMILNDYIPPFVQGSSPIILQDIAIVMLANLFSLAFTTFVLRKIVMARTAPHPKLYQAASIIGHMILALPCKVEACGKRKAKTETKPEECNGTEGSSTKVTPLSSEEERNILQKILQWLDEKDRAEEIKDQWFDIAAVLDRLAFLAMLAISIYVNWHVIHGVKNMA